MKRPIIRRAAVTVACAAALTAAGCGGNGDEQSAGETAQAYVDARNQGDTAKVCDLYSEQLKQHLGGDDCEAFVEEQTSGVKTGGFKVVSVQEDGDQATAKLQSSGEAGKPVQLTITLERQDGDWRITALGAGGGAPAGD
jgi:ABC-type glycerol-3-phosphate transport system substrate-binding protein